MKKTLTALLFLHGLYAGFPESYYTITNTSEKKEAFMQILLPLIHTAQDKIMQERTFVKYAFYLRKKLWTTKNIENKLTNLAKKYRINDPNDKDRFLAKIDVIPDTLVLAQAAAESGWGSSYFVKEANNIFGEWTWGEKGLVPRKRAKGKKHKIRIFTTLQESVDSYMLNLNRHYAYKKLRIARKSAREKGTCFKGKDATQWLKSYSGIGNKYHSLLQDIIHHNNMCEYSVRFKD